MFQFLRAFLLPAAACDGNRDGDSRYANLFRKLDLNEDGRVDIAELQTGLRAMGIPLGKEAEEVSGPCRRPAAPGRGGLGGPEGRGTARPGPPPGLGAAPCCRRPRAWRFLSFLPRAAVPAAGPRCAARPGLRAEGPGTYGCRRVPCQVGYSSCVDF